MKFKTILKLIESIANKKIEQGILLKGLSKGFEGEFKTSKKPREKEYIERAINYLIELYEKEQETYKYLIELQGGLKR